MLLDVLPTTNAPCNADFPNLRLPSLHPYGTLKDWKPEKWIQFGWATDTLATTMLTDYVSSEFQQAIQSDSVPRRPPAC